MACAATALFGLCSALSPGYWWYFVMRCITGAGVAGITSSAFLLAVEPVGPSWKGAVVLGSGYGSTVGACLLPLLAFLLPGWRALSFITAALVALVLCTVVPSVPESPRWLLSTGRKVTGSAAHPYQRDLTRTPDRFRLFTCTCCSTCCPFTRTKGFLDRHVARGWEDRVNMRAGCSQPARRRLRVVSAESAAACWRRGTRRRRWPRSHRATRRIFRRRPWRTLPRRWRPGAALWTFWATRGCGGASSSSSTPPAAPTWSVPKRPCACLCSAQHQPVAVLSFL